MIIHLCFMDSGMITLCQCQRTANHKESQLDVPEIEVQPKIRVCYTDGRTKQI